MTERWTLIAGLPGSGKSTFAAWLARKKKFLNVDMERGGLDDLGLRKAWQDFVTGAGREAFARTVRARSSRVVLDWGFPPSCLHLVSALKQRGCEVWWFDGDRLAVRAHFVGRGAEPVEAFDCHVGRISEAWQYIAPVVGANIIRTIHPDASFLSAEDTWRQFDRGAA